MVALSNLKRRASTAVNRAAAWILASEKHRVIKAIVVVWVVAQSLFTPLYAIWKDRAQAEREGLYEPPPVMLFLDDAGRCYLRNAGARPLIHVEIRRFLHPFDPVQGCHDVRGFATPGPPDAHVASLAPGDFLTTEELSSSSSRHRQPFLCPEPPGSCITLVECEAQLHRLADLKQFERLAFGGVKKDSKVEFPIVDIKEARRERGVGSTWTLDVKHEWQPAFSCAQKLRKLRKSMDALFDRFMHGMGEVVQPK